MKRNPSLCSFLKKMEKKNLEFIKVFFLDGAVNDKSQICDYFHVTEHHPVTGYSCLMFPSAGRLR